MDSEKNWRVTKDDEGRKKRSSSNHDAVDSEKNHFIRVSEDDTRQARVHSGSLIRNVLLTKTWTDPCMNLCYDSWWYTWRNTKYKFDFFAAEWEEILADTRQWLEVMIKLLEFDNWWCRRMIDMYHTVIDFLCADNDTCVVILGFERDMTCVTYLLCNWYSWFKSWCTKNTWFLSISYSEILQLLRMKRWVSVTVVTIRTAFVNKENVSYAKTLWLHFSTFRW